MDLSQVAIRYEGTSFAGAIGKIGLFSSKFSVAAKPLQEAAIATQQWNELVKALVIGWNSCAVSQDEFNSGLRRIYPRLKGDAEQIDRFATRLSRGAEIDEHQLASVLRRYVKTLATLSSIAGVEDRLREVHQDVLETKQNTEQLLLEVRQIRQTCTIGAVLASNSPVRESSPQRQYSVSIQESIQISDSVQTTVSKVAGTLQSYLDPTMRLSLVSATLNSSSSMGLILQPGSSESMKNTPLTRMATGATLLPWDSGNKLEVSRLNTATFNGASTGTNGVMSAFLSPLLSGPPPLSLVVQPSTQLSGLIQGWQALDAQGIASDALSKSLALNSLSVVNGHTLPELNTMITSSNSASFPLATNMSFTLPTTPTSVASSPIGSLSIEQVAAIGTLNQTVQMGTHNHPPTFLQISDVPCRSYGPPVQPQVKAGATYNGKRHEIRHSN